MEETKINVTLEKILYSLNDFSTSILKSINCLREDMNDMKKELKGDIGEVRNELREFKEEMNRRWDENDKRWEENDRRWEENNRRWDENDKRWEKYEINRVEDRDTILDILLNYDISISEQLGDPNVEKMRKLV